MPVSEEQLAELPPQYADRVRAEEQEWGPGAAEAVYESIIRRLGTQGTMPPPDPSDLSLLQRTGPRPESLGRAYSEARLKEAERQPPGLSFEEAGQRGTAAAREIMEAPRTARGERVEAAELGTLYTGTLPEAFIAAMKPQPLIAPEEMPGARIARTMRDEEIKSEQDALRATARQRAGAVHKTGQNEKALEEQYYLKAARDLAATKREGFRAEARRRYYDQPGVTVADERNTEQRRKQEEEIGELSDEMYLDWRDLAFKDLDIPGEDKPQRSLSTQAKRLARWAFVSETSEGVPYESVAAAGLRDLIVLMRPFTKTAFEAISYEVDEEGNPLDTNDINYKLYQYQEKALRDIYERKGTPLDYALTSDLGAFFSGAATRTWAPEDATPMEKQRVEVSTGNQARDIIISMAHGNFLGTDVAELVPAKNFYEGTGFEWVPWVSGLLMEFPIPITPVGVVSPGVKAALKGGEGVAAKAGLENIEAGFRALREPVRAATRQVVRREAVATMEGLDAGAMAVRAVEDASGVGQISELMAESVAHAVRVGKTANFKGNNLASEVIKTLDTVYPQVIKVANASDVLVKGAKVTPRVEKFADSKLGHKIIQEVRIAEAQGIAKADIPEEVVKQLAKPLFKEHLANVIPNNWLRVGPYTLVTRKAFDEVGPKVQAQIKDIQKTVEVGDKVRFLRPKQMAMRLRREMGASKIATNPFAMSLYKNVKQGKPISQDQAGWLRGFVEADIWKRAIDDAVGLEPLGRAGAAYERSLTPTVRRLSVFRNADTLYRGIRSLFRKGFPTPPSTVGIRADPGSSVVLTHWLDDTQQIMTDLPRRFNKKVAANLEKHNGDAAKAWDALMNELLVGESALLAAAAKGAGAPIPPAEAATSALADIVIKFFGKTDAEVLAFNIETGSSLVFQRALMDAGIDTLNIENIHRAIALARSNQKSLKGRGLREPTVRGIGFPARGPLKGLAREQPMAAAIVWAMDKMRKATLLEQEAKLAKQYPELLFGFGRLEREVPQMVDSMTALGVPDSVARAVAAHGSRLTAANRKEVAEQVLGDLFEYGTVNSLYARERLFAAITQQGRVTDAILQIKPIRDAVDKYARGFAGYAPGTPGYDAWFRTYVEALSEQVFQSLTGINVDRYIGMLGSMGIGVGPTKRIPGMPGARVRPQNYDFFPSVAAMEGAKRGMFLSPVDAAIFKKLKETTFSGKLGQSLESLKLADAPLAEAVAGYLFLALNTARRSTISGFLGGFPLPSFRFLGQNNITAPMITSITSPSYTWAAIKAIPEGSVGRLASVVGEANVPGSRRLATWAQIKYYAAPDDVVMTTVNGRKYTKAELERLKDTHNVRFSQHSFEFGDVVFAEAMRAAALMGDLQPAGRIRSALRWLDPRKKNIWGRWAEESDMAFRESVFTEALARGETPKVAGVLARNALLDYGSIPGKYQKWLGVMTLFYAFMLKNIQEVAYAFLRDPGAVRNLRRLVVTSYEQQKKTGISIYADDYTRDRLWGYYGKEWDGVWTGHFGPQVPAIQGFETLINAFAILFGADSSSYLFTEHFEEDFIANPLLKYQKEKYRLLKRREGKSAPLDGRYVEFFKSMGQWEIAQSFFNIESVPKDDMRPGDPVWMEDGVPTQYRLKWEPNKKHTTRWLRFQAAAALLGVDRNIRDYTSSLVKAGTVSEDAQLKRHADGSFWLYAVNLDTPMKVTGEAQATMRMRYAMQTELNALSQ